MCPGTSPGFADTSQLGNLHCPPLPSPISLHLLPWLGILVPRKKRSYLGEIFLMNKERERERNSLAKLFKTSCLSHFSLASMSTWGPLGTWAALKSLSAESFQIPPGTTACKEKLKNKLQIIMMGREQRCLQKGYGESFWEQVYSTKDSSQQTD